MRIVVPFTRLRDEVIDTLASVAPGHHLDLVDVSGSDHALYDLWRQLWQRREDVLVVEHDIVIHAGVVPQLLACPCEWGTFGYSYAYFGVYHGTGCVRIRGTLMGHHPFLIERAGEFENLQHPPRHWCSLDAFMQYQASLEGIELCRHEPPVEHLGAGVSHGCVTAPITA